MSVKKVNQLNQPFIVYANKLENFLKYRRLDKDVCLLLGVIAGKSVRKHTALYDEIEVAIVDLRMNNRAAAALVSMARTYL